MSNGKLPYLQMELKNTHDYGLMSLWRDVLFMRETGTLSKNLRRVLNTYSEADLEAAIKAEGHNRWYAGELNLKRSNRQNRYYYFGITELCKVTGFTKDEMNAEVEAYFLSEPLLDRDGNPSFDRHGRPIMYVPEAKRPKNMPRKEFSEYMDNFRQWAMDFHRCDIPLPDERDGIYVTFARNAVSP